MSGPLISGSAARFVTHYFGASGRAWLEQLPEVTASATARWGLAVEHPLDGGLLSCVLAVRCLDGSAAVLKIAGPWTAARDEAVALEHWDGGPAPRLLDFDEHLSALLLERIWPGDEPVDVTCDQMAQLIRALHARPPASSQIAVLPSLAELVEDRFVTAGTEAAARSETGDGIYIEPNEEHWHGATADRFMAHVAIQEADEQGDVVSWLDHVTDEEYSLRCSVAANSSAGARGSYRGSHKDQ